MDHETWIRLRVELISWGIILAGVGLYAYLRSQGGQMAVRGIGQKVRDAADAYTAGERWIDSRVRADGPAVIARAEELTHGA